jgi:hypothetical protein
MKPAQIDLEILQGATFHKRFWYGRRTDPLGPTPDPIAVPPVNFTPYDLTGCSARMQVRPSVDSEIIWIDVDETAITLGGTAGWIDIKASAIQTAAFDFDPSPTTKRGSGVYDLELVYTNGDVIRLAQGKVTLDPEVTR